MFPAEFIDRRIERIDVSALFWKWNEGYFIVKEAMVGRGFAEGVVFRDEIKVEVKNSDSSLFARLKKESGKSVI